MLDEKRLAQELGEVKQRLQALEDKEEIRQLLSQYSYNADLSRNDGYIQLFTKEGTFELWNPDTAGFSGKAEGNAKEIFKGHDRIRELLEGPGHQSFTTRCQHLVDLALKIDVDGNQATATGYDVLTVRWLGGFGILRCSMRRWAFRRTNG